MRLIAFYVALMITAAPALAQDIVGVEDCGKAKNIDQKAGCLQSNVDYLYRLIKKNDAAATARHKDDEAKLQAATARLDDLRAEIERLKAALDKLAKPAPSK